MAPSTAVISGNELEDDEFVSDMETSEGESAATMSVCIVVVTSGQGPSRFVGVGIGLSSGGVKYARSATM